MVCSGSLEPAPTKRGCIRKGVRTMSVESIYDPQHWRFRAEELRTLAEDMKDQVAREMMLRIAID